MKNNTLYIITGPAGVGKSTISNELASLLDRSCLIEGDDIYHLVKGGYISPWKENNHMDLFYKNVISLISNCLNNGYDVVFNYIITKKELAYIKNNFPNIKIKFVLLIATKQELIRRDKLREIDCQMGDRVLILLDELLKEDFNNKYIIDTTNLDISDIVNNILESDSFIVEDL